MVLVAWPRSPLRNLTSRAEGRKASGHRGSVHRANVGELGEEPQGLEVRKNPSGDTLMGEPEEPREGHRNDALQLG